MNGERTVLVERREAVAIVRLNRPQALNAINARMIDELDAALSELAEDDAIGCVVLTGSEKAFAAGADIAEMEARTFIDAYLDDFLARWDEVAAFRKPLVAAVAGFALGGGCELALMCDMIVAADSARFGQPEIKLGVIPGAGGTQRLARAIGKAKTMDLCLTGRMMDATEAERAGLAARVVPAADLLGEAVKIAQAVAAMPRAAALMVKEAVNRAFETPLAEGLRSERRLFYSAFATQDQKEGMRAFLEKRAPAFKTR